jgi:hypothetical protein
MCVDYTSLNNECPKDPFPLSDIDQVMDPTTCGVITRSLLPKRTNLSRLHHSLRMLLLRIDAVRVKECGGHLPAVHAILF